MPRTLGGLFGFVLTAVITVMIGMFIVNRFAPLRNIVNGTKAA